MLALVSCASPATELQVVVTTDLRPATEVDRFIVDVRREGGAPTRTTTAVGPTERRLSVWHAGGALGPVHLEVAATLRGTTVVETRRTVSLRSGERRVLRIHLSRACIAPPSCGAGATCELGECRPIEVAACELDVTPCAPRLDGGGSDADAGPGDAGPHDAGPDDGAPLDAPAACVLDDGICGVGARQAAGDRVSLSSCSPTGGAALEWTVRLPSTLFARASALRLDEIGEYEAQAVVVGEPRCRATRAFRVDAAARALPIGRPSTTVRQVSARLGTLFLATADGAWAVRPALGWRDLSIGAIGSLPHPDLGSTAVRGGDPLFAARSDRDFMVRAIVTADLSSVRYEPIMLPTGDRSAAAMDTLATELATGDPGPTVMAAKDGPVRIDGAPSALRAVAPWVVDDARADLSVAVDARERAGAGAVWILKSGRLLANVALGAEPPFRGGALTTIAGEEPTALAADDRAPGRLALCGPTGVAIYDLSADWSGLSALPPPLVTVPASCRDVIFGAEGDLWIATTTGLVRTDRDGVRMWASAGDAAIGSASLDRLAAAWDGSAREIWAVSATLDVWVIAADRAP